MCIECYYPEHSPAQRGAYAELCRRYGLVATGGSDFHGPSVRAGQLGHPTVPLAAGILNTWKHFAVPAAKAQGVIQRLAASGITPTAVHSHLIGERPNGSYIHFWGKAPLEALLAGLRSALDAAR